MASWGVTLWSRTTKLSLILRNCKLISHLPKCCRSNIWQFCIVPISIAVLCTVKRLDVFWLREIADINQNYETWVMLWGKTKDRIKDRGSLWVFEYSRYLKQPTCCRSPWIQPPRVALQSLGTTNTHRRMQTRITTTKHDDWPQCWCRWQGVSSACWEQMAGQMHAWIWPWCPQTIEQHSRPHFTLSLPVLPLLCSLVPLFALTAYGNFFF